MPEICLLLAFQPAQKDPPGRPQLLCPKPGATAGYFEHQYAQPVGCRRRRAAIRKRHELQKGGLDGRRASACRFAANQPFRGRVAPAAVCQSHRGHGQDQPAARQPNRLFRFLRQRGQHLEQERAVAQPPVTTRWEEELRVK